MGYYTAFTLTVVNKDEDDTNNYVKKLNEFTNGYYNEDDYIKWYDCEKDMKKFSELHPTVLFKLQGSGEEAGDLWAEYWINGLVQDSVIRFIEDEFDFAKLKEPTIR